MNIGRTSQLKIFLCVCLFISNFSSIVSAESKSKLEPQQKPIRFGVLSIAPPSRTYLKWKPFVEYVGRELGRPIKLIVPRGFNKIKTSAANGLIDFFYINSHVFYRLKKEGKAKGVVQMQNIDGKITSRSDIFVRSDSGINSVEQLRGLRVAFVSPMGAGGYLAPRAYLYEQGVKTKKDTPEIFSKNLSTSIHKVLLGDVAAATMCGVNFRLMKSKVDTGELKVLAVSDEYPENLIAARKNIHADLLKKFQQIIVNMPNTEKGAHVLEMMYGMKIQKFIPYDPEIEKMTEKLIMQGGL